MSQTPNYSGFLTFPFEVHKFSKECHAQRPKQRTSCSRIVMRRKATPRLVNGSVACARIPDVSQISRKAQQRIVLLTAEASGARIRAAVKARAALPAIVLFTEAESGARIRDAVRERKAQPRIALSMEADFDAPTARRGPIRAAEAESTTGTARRASSASSRRTRGAR